MGFRVIVGVATCLLVVGCAAQEESAEVPKATTAPADKSSLAKDPTPLPPGLERNVDKR